MGEAKRRAELMARYAPVLPAIVAIHFAGDVGPLRKCLRDGTPEEWRKRIGLPASWYFEFLWQSARVVETEAEEIDWAQRICAAINTGIFDSYFGDCEDGEGDDTIQQELFELVRHGDMPIRCKRHFGELERHVEKRGPARGLIWAAVVEQPGLRFADVFAAVDDGIYGDDPRSRH